MTVNIETYQKLPEYLRHFADLELHVETYREKLNVLYDFEPYSCFCRLDFTNLLKLTAYDFFIFLK